MDSPNQPTKIPEAQTQSPSLVNNSSNTKLFILILIGIAVTLIAIGAYILGTKQNQPVAQNSVQTTPIPSPTPSQITECPSGLPAIEPLPSEENIVKSKFGYSIKSPKDWRIKNDCSNNAEFRIQYGDGEESSYLIFELPEENPKNLSIEDWVNSQDLNFNNYGEPFPVTKKVIVIDSKQAIQFTNEEGDFAIVYIPLKNSVFYIQFIISHRYGASKFLSEHIGDFDQILSTFQFSN